MPSYSIGLIHTFLKEKISFKKEKKNCFQRMSEYRMFNYRGIFIAKTKKNGITPLVVLLLNIFFMPF